jgi:predicted GIY-YIG superfamily endonuclease
MNYIYALVDPTTRIVRYVGQTANLQERYALHCSGKEATTGEWVRSLVWVKPFLLILDTITDSAKVTATETKWIKRFRRTVLNKKRRNNDRATWDSLVNPGER